MAQRGILVHSFFAIGSRERELIEDRSAEGIFYAASPDIATASPHLGCAYLQPETHMNANLGLFGTTSFDFWGGAQLSVAPIAVADQPQNHGITTQAIPNDARYTDGSLWGMYGDASGPANQFGSQAAEAWAQGHTGSMTNVIGVIDTGIDYTHPDLYLNIWLNQREIPTTLSASLSDIDSDGLITFRDLNGAANASYVLDYNSNGRIDAGDLLNDSRWENGIDEDGNGYRDDLIGWDFVSNDNDPRDGDGHGTHVAGTIGALGGNGIGVVGVNWNVQLVPLQIFSSYGAFAGDTAAVNYFTSAAISARASGSTENFVATNNSWGGGWYDQALLNAITAAAQQDILFIAAAGNDSSNNDAWLSYPDGYSTALITGYEAVISVASITSSGSLSDFSNFGSTSVDIAAPGSGIWSTLPNGSYDFYDGTSMATPHVTGAIALYASLFPNATSAQIREALLLSATFTGSVNDLVASDGRLNIPAMLAVAPPVTEFADWLAGTVGGDNLNGRGGNDTISGGMGGDTLNGGNGGDALIGADGNDWLMGGTGAVSSVFLSPEQNPLSFITMDGYSTPAFADLDNDGDLDLVVGRMDGTLASFRRNNDGSFTPMNGIAGNPANPFSGIDVGFDSTPTFTDLDQNGTLDLVIGRSDGSLVAFRRNLDGVLTPMDGAGGNSTNPFGNIDVGFRSAPCFHDLDLDGDPDLVLGSSFGTLTTFRRNADSSYTPMDGLNGNPANPLSNVYVGLYSTPTFADLDFDGDADLVVGGYGGNVTAFRRNADGSFSAMDGSNGNPANPFAGLFMGFSNAPVFADINGDSLPDLVVGAETGVLRLFVQSVTSTVHLRYSPDSDRI
jgi:subtilisin family serine protease